MIKHATTRNKEMIVSTSIHPSGKIQVDADGFITTELTEEAKKRLLTASDFSVSEKVAPPPPVGDLNKTTVPPPAGDIGKPNPPDDNSTQGDNKDNGPDSED